MNEKQVREREIQVGCERLVEKEVNRCMTHWVEWVVRVVPLGSPTAESAPIDPEEIPVTVDCEECGGAGGDCGECDDGQRDIEIFEWWSVSPWLGRQLAERGEVVINRGTLWGRQMTGQAILMDHVIRQIWLGELR